MLDTAIVLGVALIGVVVLFTVFKRISGAVVQPAVVPQPETKKKEKKERKPVAPAQPSPKKETKKEVKKETKKEEKKEEKKVIKKKTDINGGMSVDPIATFKPATENKAAATLSAEKTEKAAPLPKLTQKQKNKDEAKGFVVVESKRQRQRSSSENAAAADRDVPSFDVDKKINDFLRSTNKKKAAAQVSTAAEAKVVTKAEDWTSRGWSK